MGQCKVPNFTSGKRGKGWTVSLNRARNKGALIIAEETKEPVIFDPRPGGRAQFRPWIDSHGRRYDSRECVPVFY
jgi:hypothetical protein